MATRKQPSTKSKTRATSGRQPKPESAAAASSVRGSGGEKQKPKPVGEAIAELGDKVGGPA